MSTNAETDDAFALELMVRMPKATEAKTTDVEIS